jgi:hypothetical protein
VDAGVAALRDAGLRVRGPCRSAPVPPQQVDQAGPGPGDGLSGFACWVPLWFDRSRRYWLEVLLPSMADAGTMEFRGADPLACILGVLPAGFDGILRHRRGEAGLWVRRELGDMGELRGTLQLTLARGAHAVYRSRCRSMATWWASADALEHRVSRARQLAVRRRKKRVERARAALDKWAQDRPGRGTRTGPCPH